MRSAGGPWSGTGAVGGGTDEAHSVSKGACRDAWVWSHAVSDVCNFDLIFDVNFVRKY